MIPLPRASRALATAVTAIAIGGLLSGCSQGPMKPPIEATVTFKTVERPHLAPCSPDEYGCGYDRMQEISTRYRVEVTYPDDADLFTVESDYYQGRECWFSVQPDEYESVELGQVVLLGNPANSDWSGETPGGCELAEDLSPNDVMPSEEWTPSDEEFDNDPASETQPETQPEVTPEVEPSDAQTSPGDATQG